MAQPAGPLPPADNEALRDTIQQLWRGARDEFEKHPDATLSNFIGEQARGSKLVGLVVDALWPLLRGVRERATRAAPPALPADVQHAKNQALQMVLDADARRRTAEEDRDRCLKEKDELLAKKDKQLARKDQLLVKVLGTDQSVFDADNARATRGFFMAECGIDPDTGECRERVQHIHHPTSVALRIAKDMPAGWRGKVGKMRANKVPERAGGLRQEPGKFDPGPPGFNFPIMLDIEVERPNVPFMYRFIFKTGPLSRTPIVITNVRPVDLMDENRAAWMRETPGGPEVTYIFVNCTTEQHGPAVMPQARYLHLNGGYLHGRCVTPPLDREARHLQAIEGVKAKLSSLQSAADVEPASGARKQPINPSSTGCANVQWASSHTAGKTPAEDHPALHAPAPCQFGGNQGDVILWRRREHEAWEREWADPRRRRRYDDRELECPGRAYAVEEATEPRPAEEVFGYKGDARNGLGSGLANVDDYGKGNSITRDRLVHHAAPKRYEDDEDDDESMQEGYDTNDSGETEGDEDASENEEMAEGQLVEDQDMDVRSVSSVESEEP